MANENQISYFRIGLVIVIGLAAIVGTLLFLGGLGGRAGEILAETYYDKPVSGLSVGSAVNFRGVQVGEVREISFVGAKYHVPERDGSRIYILMAIRRDLLDPYGAGNAASAEACLRRHIEQNGLRATVTASGITGLSRIECDFHSPESVPPPVEIKWQPEHVFIPPKVSLLDSFGVSATKVMNQINRMDLNAFWSNVHASVESVSSALLTLDRLLEANRPEFERMLGNLEDASASLKAFADRLRENPAVILRGTVQKPLPETER